MGKVIELNDKNFEEVVNNSDKPILVDFWAGWCGPCRVMGPIVEEVAEKYGDKMNFAKLNVDDYPQVAAKFGVMSIPTFLVFENGEVKNQLLGAMTKEEFIERLGLK
jgi:thioredoxin 1